MGLKLPGSFLPGAEALPRSRPGIRDVLVSLSVVGLDIVLFSSLSDATDQVGWAGVVSPAAVVVAGLVAVPIVSFRRVVPGPACLALAAHAAAVTCMLGSRPFISLVVTLYAAAVGCGLRWALAALSAVLAAHTLAVAYEASFTGSDPRGLAVVAIALVYLLVDVSTWSAGRWGASAAARAHAARLEASRAELARTAIETERMRIARELHDIVAHAITVMILQSAGAQRVAASSPGQASEAMQSVEMVGRQAIAELRRMLEVLRADGRVPSPDGDAGDRLRGLGALVARVQDSGVPVRTQVAGVPGALDPSVDLTAYRVVQEGLTNVAKHAGVGTESLVELQWEPRRLVVTVGNGPPLDKPSVAPEASGYGLVGLAERVKLVGGRLEVGPTEDGGFRLEAELPVADHVQRDVGSREPAGLS